MPIDELGIKSYYLHTQDIMEVTHHGAASLVTYATHKETVLSLTAAQKKIEELEKLNVEFSDLRVKTLTFESELQKTELARQRDEITQLKAQLKEHEDKGLAIYGRKIDVLNGTVRVLEAKLAKVYEWLDGFPVEQHYDDAQEFKKQLNSITLESLKGE